MKKLLAILLALIMMMTMIPALAETVVITGTLQNPNPEITPDNTEWEVSKSKTATNLNAAYESEITLSLPSAEEELVSDIVFVLDKSTSSTLEDQALGMLKDLKNQVEKTGAIVKVGVVIFNKIANVTNFLDLKTQYDDIETAIQQEIESGTNTHAGLLAGKKMLDDDTGVAANRKYLIFVSDGITYMFNESPTAVAWSFFGDEWKNWAGPDNWNSKYGNNNPPDDWNNWLSIVGTQVKKQGTEYEYPYGSTPTNSTPQDDTSKNYANSIDKALYLTKQVYQEAIDAGYNCYAMGAETSSGESYLWGPCFMQYLADNQTVTFDKIKKDIFYLLAAGSTVTDIMGKAADYDFDFINNAADISLKVGDTAYTVSAKTEGLEENETARYLFTSDGVTATNNNEAPFVLHYYNKGTDGNGDECFIWDINVPISNFAPAKLTYKVKLTNPKTTAGTYGTYDKDGSKNYAGLHTNNSAILKPVNSNGVEGKSEEFNRPTVSYTVGGGSSGGTIPGHSHYYPTTPVPVIVIPPKTGDMTIWQSILHFLGIR